MGSFINSVPTRIRFDGGQTGRNRIFRADGSEEHLEGTATVRLDVGDSFVIETPGGGGYEAAD